MTDAPVETAPLAVVRIISRLNIGGPARHVVLLDRALGTRGFDTLLVHGTVDSGEASLEHLADESGVHRLKIPDLGRRVSPISDLRALVQLVGIIFERSPDIVHTHTAKAGTLGRIAALAFNVTRRRQRRCAVVHTFHGNVLSGYFGRLATTGVRAAERILATCSDRIVAISELQRRELVDRFRIATSDRTVVIPLGLDLAPLLQTSNGRGLRHELGIATDDVVVGYVGRFVPIKDLRTLVRGFAAAHQRHPKSWLLLAGDGPMRFELERLAGDVGVGTSVRFLGWNTELPELYATFDICALSSANEGTPVAIIEAMAAAKPVIATRVGGVPDVVDHGRTGLLVPPGDPDAFAAAIVRLIQNPSERYNFGDAARQVVVAKFSVDRLATDIQRLYEGLVREKRSFRRPR